MGERGRGSGVEWGGGGADSVQRTRVNPCARMHAAY